ncbi:hypothetical protein [Aeromicrobium sp. 9AM]|uniref:hypothetical protein n=1 Tax=Aeromicrobium sp. 9AM TaxID=2653126 RepID=UPI0012F05FE0|nr:hypothetical protein [Aeromicrobium sp. 9AM]VXB82768.1 conserved hypothetical protein [Aeromicrobium sp. 9AM]
MQPLRNTPRVEVDEVAVQRRIDGDKTVQLNYLERRTAVELLAPRGLSDSQIGDLLDLTSSAVAKIRDRHQIESRVTA